MIVHYVGKDVTFLIMGMINELTGFLTGLLLSFFYFTILVVIAGITVKNWRSFLKWMNLLILYHAFIYVCVRPFIYKTNFPPVEQTIWGFATIYLLINAVILFIKSPKHGKKD
jgi:hypothetical protein